MNKGDGVFVDETETRVDSPDYLDNMSGGGKKLKIVYDAIEVLESNLIRAEEFLKNN